jgi:prefoldin subunit 5
MSVEEIHQKMSEYSTFLDKVLRPELQSAESASRKVKTEIEEYNELGLRLKKLAKDKPSQLESMVDLGHKTIFCNAVAKVDSIFVHVGMGFHAELTIPEAIAFVDKRISFLENDSLSGKERKVTKVEDHIVSAGGILSELERELQRASRR